MSQSWFTDEEYGELQVVRREDGWYVEPSGVAGETKCLLSGSVERDSDVQELEVRVKSYRKGSILRQIISP